MGGRAQEARTISRFYQGLMNDWASRYRDNDAAIFVEGVDQELGAIKAENQKVKDRLAERISTAFAGKTAKKGILSGVEVSKFGLERMRDLDVRDFLEILRDQAIACLDMKNVH